jgi:HAD superfamily hydrolase (TIGR01484 family)
MDKTFLCSDLDRTLLPNGRPPESPKARRLLRQAAKLPDLTLAYVTGRNRSLIQKAIEAYDLPLPAFAVGDVGTAIYRPDRNWEPLKSWTDEIRVSWQEKLAPDLAVLLSDINGLHLQEGEHQTAFKLSYYADMKTDPVFLRWEIKSRLAGHGIQAAVVWSVDEQKGIGLLDIVPKNATKHHAIRFLQERYGFQEDRIIFAGDSGNDLEALTGGLQAVLVKNALPEVQQEAVRTMREKGMPERLYLAQGGFMEMNGNYSAGVLEGLAHFLPETAGWLACDP